MGARVECAGDVIRVNERVTQALFRRGRCGEQQLCQLLLQGVGRPLWGIGVVDFRLDPPKWVRQATIELVELASRRPSGSR